MMKEPVEISSVKLVEDKKEEGTGQGSSSCCH